MKTKCVSTVQLFRVPAFSAEDFTECRRAGGLQQLQQLKHLADSSSSFNGKDAPEKSEEDEEPHSEKKLRLISCARSETSESVSILDPAVL